MTDRVPQRAKRLGHMACAFAGPPQGRHGIPARRRVDQAFEVIQQEMIVGGQTTAATARATDACRHGLGIFAQGTTAEFGKAMADGGT
jgi:hypothetical protein